MVDVLLGMAPSSYERIAGMMVCDEGRSWNVENKRRKGKG